MVFRYRWGSPGPAHFLSYGYRCVITELFTEGTAPFDLSQLLSYRNREYSPWKVLEKIEDTSIRVGTLT